LTTSAEGSVAAHWTIQIYILKGEILEDLDKRLAELGLLDALARLPENVALTTDEAAIFLRLSTTTLERMRKKGDGPTYTQAGGKDAKGTNQKCHYIKKDLLAYQSSNRVTSSLSAAVRRGQAFMPFQDPTPKRSDFDLVTKRPFYLDSNRRILSCVDDEPLRVVIDRLGVFKIEWLAPILAASRVWSDTSPRKSYADLVKSALNLAIQKIDGVADPSS